MLHKGLNVGPNGCPQLASVAVDLNGKNVVGRGHAHGLPATPVMVEFIEPGRLCCRLSGIFLPRRIGTIRVIRLAAY